MAKIDKLGYVATAKVFGVFGLIGGIIEAILLIAGASIFGGLMGGAIGVAGAVFAIIGGVIGGFIGGFIWAFLYNVLVSKVTKLESE